MIMEEEWKDDGNRHYAWIVVRNNYQECDEIAVYALSLESSSGAFGKEVGDSGTPHYQGFVFFKTVKSFTQVQQLLPKFDLRPKSKHSTFHDAWFYTQKGTQPKQEWSTLKTEGPTFGVGADTFTWGTCPCDPKVKGARSEEWYRRNAALCMTKPDEMDHSAQFMVDQFQRSVKTVKRTRMMAQVERLPGVPCHHFSFHTGVPGSGKTHWSIQGQPTKPYEWTLKTGWNGYDFEEIVVFQDLDHASAPDMCEVKRWFDLEPFQVRILYGTFFIRPKVMIINSNEDTFADMFPGWKAAHVAALQRRFRFFHWPEPYYANEALQILNPSWTPAPGLNGEDEVDEPGPMWTEDPMYELY